MVLRDAQLRWGLKRSPGMVTSRKGEDKLLQRGAVLCRCHLPGMVRVPWDVTNGQGLHFIYFTKLVQM